jgi:hypothetical protein
MKQENKKPVWTAPWGYTEGWLIVSGLLATGLALQIATGGLNRTAFSWPVNMYIGTLFTAMIAAGWLFNRDQKKTPVQWLASIPAAITSISMVTFLVLLMGFTLQDDTQNPVWVQTLGLSNMTASWPFLFGITYFLIALGMATMKRLVPFKGRNIGFFLNHAGLYVIILGGMLGSADLQRYTMQLHEGEIVWTASDNHGHSIEMPLALELVSFNMEEYNPKVVVIDPYTGRIIPESIPQMFEIETGNRGNILGYEVEIEQFHMLSGKMEDRYEPANHYGAAPAALVRVTTEEGNIIEGWISTGSFMMPHSLLDLNHIYEYSLAMTIPQASHYSSDVILYTRTGDVKEVQILVNHPVNAEGWKLYQYSYDDRFGRWSPTSVIEAIRDPWLPFVYAGIFMVMAGSVYLMTLGKTPQTVYGEMS